jgi:hypothetical protein
MKRLVLACALAGGCYTDAAPEPEPSGGTEPLVLSRVLVPFFAETGNVLFVTTYRVDPSTFDEARAIAQGPEPPIRFEIDYLSVPILMGYPHEVVWFRTLTAEELARIP